MKKYQLKRKLLIQVGLVVVPIFLIMIAAVTFSVYRSTVRGFLEAQNDHMTEILESEAQSGLFGTTFFLDYWEQHPDMTELDLPQKDVDAIVEYFNEHTWSEMGEWLKSNSEAYQGYMAYSAYQLIEEVSKLDESKKSYDSLFIIDINPPNEGFIYWERGKDKDEDIHKLGDRLDISLSDYPELENLLEEPTSEIFFTRMKDFTMKGSQYIGFKPIVIEGKVRAVMGISYNWSQLRNALIGTVWKTFSIGIIGMLAAMVILFMMLYFRAIKPVKIIQEGVCDYIDSKDSSEIAQKLSVIKAKNEFGSLSGNLTELAREIDQYTAENIKLAGERERVAAELDMAQKIQTQQLPGVFPAFPDRTDFDICASMTPAKEVGGDFYDYFLVDEDHLALVMADVSGKGVPAALFMMMSKILINNYTLQGLSPHEVLEVVNDTICRNNTNGMFVTVWLGILEISTGKITAANAGHEYPVIRQPGGSYELFKDRHGFVLGGKLGKKYKEYELTLQKGGTLFLYTDGVPEATDNSENMFGTERLTEVLSRDPDASPDRLIEAVHSAVNEFVGDAPQFDDLTMMAVKLL